MLPWSIQHILPAENQCSKWSALHLMASPNMVRHLHAWHSNMSSPPTSPIYHMLHVLPLMNLMVSEDDLTSDKDYKHVFKQLCNLLLQDKGTVVHGVHLKPSVICSHLHNNDKTSMCINYLLNPDDLQDVKLTYDMLHEIWSLPDSQPDALPGFQ